MGDSRLARFLQGGGVYMVGYEMGGLVTIDSCTITGNTAYYVRATPNFPSPRWDFHMFCALCLQGGGVFINSGIVTISWSTISGNAADYVRAHAQEFPMAPMGKWLTCLS